MLRISVWSRQYSVFECFISLDEMRLLYAKVKTKINLEEDNVRFYWLSSEATSNVLTLGSKPPETPPSYYII